MKDIHDATELDQLDRFLERIENGAIPNVEALDGMFAALACCPDVVSPSEFLPVIERGASDNGDLVLTDLEELEQFMGLIVRHWNRVNSMLSSEGTYFPPLQSDMHGAMQGNDWAHGFVTGMKLRRHLWGEFSQSEECAALLAPIMFLAYEDHPDPELRPLTKPLDPEQRADLIARAAAAVVKLHARLVRSGEVVRPEAERLH
jgi:uncharacterized protein